MAVMGGLIGNVISVTRGDKIVTKAIDAISIRITPKNFARVIARARWI
jgi:hypothetical protein